MNEPGIGHNSGGTADIAESGVAADELKAFVERIERIEAEKQAAADDLKELYAEIKGRGFDTKVLRKIIALRKIDHSSRQEFVAILELYAEALGMQNVFA